jgi:hypothetical protein
MIEPKTGHPLACGGGSAPSARRFARAFCLVIFAVIAPATVHAQGLRGSFDALPGADPDMSPYALGPAPDDVFGAAPDTLFGEEIEPEPLAEDGSPPQLTISEPRLRKRLKTPEDEDPYEQLGIRAGAFLLKPAIELYGGYETNPNSSNVDPQGSAYGRTKAELDAESDWARHAFRGRIEGEYTAYDEFPDLNAPRYSADGALRIDARRDLRLDFALRSALDSQSPGDPDLPDDVKGRPQNFRTGASAGATWKPNRLSVGGIGEVDRRVYEDAETNSGGIIDNEDENYTAYEVRLRTGYELDPGLEPFVEASVNRRNYDLKINDSGVLHDSSGFRTYLGVRIEPDPIWALEAKLGYGEQEAEDPTIPVQDGLVAQGSLIWRPSALTTFWLTAEKDFSPTSRECCVIADEFTAELRFEHDFRRYLTLSGSLKFDQEKYSMIDYTLRNFDAELGLEYKFNRTVSAKARVAHERVVSTIEGEDYETSVIEVGLRVQR